jgi:hypothetical protein
MPSKLGRLEDARTLRLASRRIVGGQTGHAPTSSYVETFWLPVLGPSTTWLIRLLNHRLDSEGENVEVSVADTGWALGLGERPGRHSPLIRALGRAADFDLVMRALPTSSPIETTSGPSALPLLVRRTLPPLPSRLVERLPPLLARAHHEVALEGAVRVVRDAAPGPTSVNASGLAASRRVLAASFRRSSTDVAPQPGPRLGAPDLEQPIASRYAN